MTDADRLPFLRAIVQSPDDDLPRLVYADFLEESGEAAEVARAHFVRVQCELDKCPHLQITKPWCEIRNRREALSAMESELLLKYDLIWFPLTLKIKWHRGFVSEIHLPLTTFLGGRCENCEGEGRIETGFRENSYGPCPDCGGDFEPTYEPGDLGYYPGTGQRPGLGRIIAEREPVEKWVLTDREPQLMTGGEWRWARVIRDELNSYPQGLPRELIPATYVNWMHPTRESALDALGEACWLYANRPRIEAEAEVRFVARDPGFPGLARYFRPSIRQSQVGLLVPNRSRRPRRLFPRLRSPAGRGETGEDCFQGAGSRRPLRHAGNHGLR